MVENHTDCVVIHAVFASPEARRRFVDRIQNEHPPIASIQWIEVHSNTNPGPYSTFSIASSLDNGNCVTQVAPDMAVCPECLNDRLTQEHRKNYPFINCTYCGPRFSIMRDLPYDRPNTTMQPFTMCRHCHREYGQADNRRYHAQPVACNHCGPQYHAVYNGERYTGYDDLLELSARLLSRGEVIAVKGIGGYHLVCDATNEQSAARLREIKARDTKPFAVMFRDLASAENHAHVSEAEAGYLTSRRRPVVLLKQHRPLACAVNPKMHTLGVMLPYMPIHYDWFERIDTPALVMTSGNRHDRPIALDESEANEQFGLCVSLILHHNREIHNRVDDSVMHVCGNLPSLIRRSRGYAPEPFFADASVDGILAFGAEQANTFALGKGDIIVQSQHIGELKNWETFRFYTGAIENLSRLFRFTPNRLVCDLHPGYQSTLEAERRAAAHGLPLTKVQHHHAHAVACMAEHQLYQPVIAIVMDGTGLGSDGHIWGGEFLLCTRRSYRRLSHLEYLPMPGGDKASTEPWRMAVASLHSWNLPLPASLIARVGEKPVAQLRQMIAQKLYTPLTSGAGRLFDAVASLLGLCDVATYQAEAPVLLEQAAAGAASVAPYPFDAKTEVVSLRKMMEALLDDIERGETTEYISARFHTTLAHLFLEKARLLMRQTDTTEVVVSGGCFQNKRLVTELQQLFSAGEIPLHIPSRIPCNDSGISVGQVIIASQENY